MESSNKVEKLSAGQWIQKLNVMPDFSASQANFMHTDFIALKLMSNELNSGLSVNLKNKYLADIR